MLLSSGCQFQFTLFAIISQSPLCWENSLRLQLHLPSPALLPALTCPALAERGLKRVLCDGKCGLAASRNKAHAAHESILIIPDISSTCVPPLLQSLYLIGKSGIVLECLIKNPSKYRVLLNRRGALLGKSTSILNESACPETIGGALRWVMQPFALVYSRVPFLAFSRTSVSSSMDASILAF